MSAQDKQDNAVTVDARNMAYEIVSRVEHLSSNLKKFGVDWYMLERQKIRHELEQALAAKQEQPVSESSRLQYSVDGDTWRDCPSDAEFVFGKELGATFELQSSDGSTSKFRVTKVPDDTSDDHDVQPVSEPVRLQYSRDLDVWRDSPSDIEFTLCRPIGDTYMLHVSTGSKAKFCITKVPDETGDDYEVMQVSVPVAEAVNFIRSKDGGTHWHELETPLQEWLSRDVSKYFELRTLYAHPHPAIPEDWQPVPKDPTEIMVVRGFEAASDFEDTDEYQHELSGCEGAAKRARICYDAMLAAAPTPPTVSNT